jgi:hypothetical protein
MDSLNRRDYLNRADVYGVRILKLRGSSVKAEIHSVYKLFLIWLKPNFSNPVDCNHSLFVYPFKIPAFDGMILAKIVLSKFSSFSCRKKNN